MNKLEQAKQRMLDAVRAYRDAANDHAAQCVNFRDKLEHYRATESAMYEAEGILSEINDHAEEVDLCNTACPMYRAGSCAYSVESCPRYVERLNRVEEIWT